MKISLETSHQTRLYLQILLVTAILTSCTPANHRVLPPESYNGPTAEQPLFQKGDFWIYEAGNAARTKSTGLYPNLNFPLWIGKTWSYETESEGPICRQAVWVPPCVDRSIAL